MKLPKEIVGRNKLRDSGILLDWADGLMTIKAIALKYKLTQLRIEQILRANHAYIPIDREYERKRRMRNLKIWEQTAKEPEVDKLTLQREMREELRQDSASIVSVGVTVMPSIIKDGKEMEFKVGNRITS